MSRARCVIQPRHKFPRRPRRHRPPAGGTLWGLHQLQAPAVRGGRSKRSKPDFFRMKSAGKIAAWWMFLQFPSKYGMMMYDVGFHPIRISGKHAEVSSPDVSMLQSQNQKGLHREFFIAHRLHQKCQCKLQCCCHRNTGISSTVGDDTAPRPSKLWQRRQPWRCNASRAGPKSKTLKLPMADSNASQSSRIHQNPEEDSRHVANCSQSFKFQAQEAPNSN